MIKKMYRQYKDNVKVNLCNLDNSYVTWIFMI